MVLELGSLWYDTTVYLGFDLNADLDWSLFGGISLGSIDILGLSGL